MSHSTSEDIADILASSREVLEKVGWGQGEFVVFEYDEAGEQIEAIGYCALGGLAAAQGIAGDEIVCHDKALLAVHALARVAGVVEHENGECVGEEGLCTCVTNWVVGWNDS